MGKMKELAIKMEEEKMIKDLVIGNASNYTWNDLKYWVNSLYETGYSGDVMLTGTNIKIDDIEELTERGVKLNLYGTKMDDGSVESREKGIPHVDRFFYIWNAMEQTKEQYRYVITTDTRDVVFQANPMTFLEDLAAARMGMTEKTLVASSEGMLYKDEPWGNGNLFQSMGPFFHKRIQEQMIYNVGVIGGRFDVVRDLMLMIFQLSMNRPIAIVDQAVYNFILNVPLFRDMTYLSDNEDGWAIQLGTTEEAVKSGSGDLGIQYRSNPKPYKNKYLDIQPEFQDHLVINPKTGMPYYIVHQYDRIPDLKTKVHERYGA